MSAFKERVAADIKSVFLNALEFAEPHEIRLDRAAPVTVLAVVDRDVLKDRAPLTQTIEAREVFESEVHVYVEAKDLPRRPVEGERMRLDGTLYIVATVAENMGIYEITARANLS